MQKSHSLLLPKDLLSNHYNVNLSDIEKALAKFGIKNAKIKSKAGSIGINYRIEAKFLNVEKLLDSKKWAKLLNIQSIRITKDDLDILCLEVPYSNHQIISLKGIINSEEFVNTNIKLSVALGTDTKGNPVVIDLAKSSHLLIASMSGADKSVCINTILISLLFRFRADQINFMLIDPKVVELSIYNDIPHLITPIITDMKKAEQALWWCINEVKRRYHLFSLLKVSDISSFNEKIDEYENLGMPIPDPTWRVGDTLDLVPPILKKLSCIVTIVDEFADLMIVGGRQVGESIIHILNKAHLVGIHLVLATQKFSSDVITSLIKANIPSHITLTVASDVNSEFIPKGKRAMPLLEARDMLYSEIGSSSITHVHGAFVSNDEIVNVTDFWRNQGKPQYVKEIFATEIPHIPCRIESVLDPLFEDIRKFVIETGTVSIAGIMRKFNIDFIRAVEIIDILEINGVVSKLSETYRRELLVTEK